MTTVNTFRNGKFPSSWTRIVQEVNNVLDGGKVVWITSPEEKELDLFFKQEFPTHTMIKSMEFMEYCVPTRDKKLLLMLDLQDSYCTTERIKDLILSRSLHIGGRTVNIGSHTKIIIGSGYEPELFYDEKWTADMLGNLAIAVRHIDLGSDNFCFFECDEEGNVIENDDELDDDDIWNQLTQPI